MRRVDRMIQTSGTDSVVASDIDPGSIAEDASSSTESIRNYIHRTVLIG